MKAKSLSRFQLFATPWTVAHQPPPSVGFSRQEYWSGVPLPSLGDLPTPGIEPESPELRTDALPSEPLGNTHWTFPGMRWALGASKGAWTKEMVPGEEALGMTLQGPAQGRCFLNPLSHPSPSPYPSGLPSGRGHRLSLSVSPGPWPCGRSKGACPQQQLNGAVCVRSDDSVF